MIDPSQCRLRGTVGDVPSSPTVFSLRLLRFSAFLTFLAFPKRLLGTVRLLGTGPCRPLSRRSGQSGSMIDPSQWPPPRPVGDRIP